MIDKENRDYAYRLFQCLVVSKRPLLVEELAELFAIEPIKDSIAVYNPHFRPENPEEFIVSTCSTLVAVIHSRGQKIVRFSHFSVREYLTSDRISNSRHVSHFHVLPRPAHTLFSRACLSVLLHLGDDMDRDKIQDFPLASYAAEYWVDHAQVDGVSSDLKYEMECIFDKNKPHFKAWLRLYNIDDPISSFHSQTYPDPLYYAALCGFRDIAEHLITARRQAINARGGLHVTPLHAALDKGYTGVAVLLLERGADIESRNSRNWTPLHKASYHGYIDVMTSLIDLDANLDAEEDSRETPLYFASKYGRQDAARLLLARERHADTNHPDMHGRTPLHAASREGRDQVVSLLLDHCVDFNLSDRDGWTALHYASWLGYGVIVGSLLDRGADANYRNNLGQTPLHLASQQGHDHVVRSLLDHKVDVNPSDRDGWIPLHLALWQGCTSRDVASLERRNNTIRLLLNHGADPSSIPHHIASRESDRQLLRDHGQRRITGIVMPGLHYVLHRERVVTSSSGYYSIRF